MSLALLVVLVVLIAGLVLRTAIAVRRREICIEE